MVFGCFLTLTAIAQTPNSIDLVLQDTPLGVALKLVTDQAGLKFEAHAPLEEMVDVNLQGVSLESAFADLLKQKPYMWTLDDGIVHVFRGQQSLGSPLSVAPSLPAVELEPKTPTITRICTLQKRKADGVLALVTRLNSKDLTIVADDPTNSLVMIGQEKQIEAVEKLAREIDETPVTYEVSPPEELISESYSLEYVTEFKDLEKSLDKILYGEHFPSETGVGNDVQAQIQSQLLNALPTPQTRVPGAKNEFYMLDKIRRVLLITATRSKMDLIRKYFNQINTPVPQVLIEAHIIALEDGTDRNLGISWNMQERWGGTYSSPELRSQNTLNSGGVNSGQQIGGGFQFGRLDLSNVTAVLQAVQEKNRGQILSQPRLMTLSGKSATIDISTQYPYKSSVTLNQTGTTQNVQFVNVGITLEVVPQVNLNADSVVMQLDPNVSDLVSLSADGPITTQRRTSTNVEVKNGETVVIGGLLRDEDARSNKTVPFLSKIPVIGDFFKFSQKRKKRTNLMILITPKIVRALSATGDSSPSTVAPVFPPPSSSEPTVQKPVSIPSAPGPNSGQNEFHQRLEELRTKYLKNE
jgi:general secretion pathway protein D